MFESRSGRYYTINQVLNDFCTNHAFGIKTLVGSWKNKNYHEDGANLDVCIHDNEYLVNLHFDDYEPSLGFTKNGINGLTQNPENISVFRYVKSPYSNRRSKVKIIDMNLKVGYDKVNLFHNYILPEGSPIIDRLISDFRKLNYVVTENC